jgi:multicomponent Na+:H+ antiporter subunit E
MTATAAFFLNLLLAGFWALATGRLTSGTFLIGFMAGFATLLVMRRAIGTDVYVRKFNGAVRLLVLFLYELVKANIRIAYDIVTPTHYMRPAILAIPLDARSDFEITLLANMITLTPGTLTLHVAEDRSVLYIHSVYTPDPERLRRTIKEGFEARILELTR